jgi:hypothetical protein
MKHENARVVPLERVEGRADVELRLRRIAGKARFSALATISADGPHLSLIAFAITPDSREIIFATPKDTIKYANIVADPRVSVLIEGSETPVKDVMEAEAISLDGHASVVRRGKRRSILERLLLAIHPELEEFLAAPTTALIAIKVGVIAHVEDFQRVSISSRQ